MKKGLILICIAVVSFSQFDFVKNVGKELVKAEQTTENFAKKQVSQLENEVQKGVNTIEREIESVKGQKPHPQILIKGAPKKIEVYENQKTEIQIQEEEDLEITPATKEHQIKAKKNLKHKEVMNKQMRQDHRDKRMDGKKHHKKGKHSKKSWEQKHKKNMKRWENKQKKNLKKNLKKHIKKQIKQYLAKELVFAAPQKP